VTSPDTNVPRIALPAVPQPAAPFRFPVVAATVPVVASLGIWLITGSTFALIFAALGPLAAVGSYVDSRVTALKKLREEKLRFARDVVATHSAIDTYHRWESSELAERTPPGVFLVRDVHADSSRWVCEPHGGLLLHLGYGNVRSNLSIDGAAYRDGIDAATAEEYQRLIEYASTLPHAPIAVNAQLGIAIFGSELIALSLARALAIQLARTLSPQTSWVRVQGALSDEQWVSHLPHRVVQSADSADLVGGPRARASVEWGQLGDDSPTISICVISNEEQVPSGHRIVIGATGQTIAIVGHPDRYQRRDFDPSFLGREQALVWALAAQEIASRDGLTTSRSAVPDSIHFRELLLRRETGVDQSPRRAHSLESRPAAGVRGPFVVDLVANAAQRGVAKANC
jgi:S-DNA-T family DNA segregation ATPase FtsK/SpoIIIE